MRPNPYLKITIAILCFLAFVRVYSQAPSDSSKVIRPVPIVEIPQYLEKTNQVIKEIENLVKLPPEVDKIDTVFINPKNELNERFEVLSDSSEYYSISDLENELRVWKDVEIEILNYNDMISKYVKDIQLKTKEVDQYLATWDTTAINAKNQSAPNEILSIIKEGKQKLDGGKVKLIKAQQTVLRLQAGISPYFSIVNEAQSIIGDRKNELLNTLWLQDSPYLWNVRFDSTKTLAHIHMGNRVADNWSNMKRFVGGNEIFKVFFILIFLTLIIYILYLKNNHSKIIDKYYDAENFNLLIKFPFLTTTLLTLLLTSIFFDLPISVLRFYALGIIIPAGIFVYHKSDDYKIHQFLILSTTFIYQQSTHYIIGSNFERIHILALSILLFAGLVFIRKRKFDFLMASLLNRPLIRFLLNFYALINLFAIGLNIAGRFELAKLLAMGTSTSLIIGVVYYLGVRLTTSLVSVFLIGTPLEKSNIVKSHHEFIIKQISRILGFIAVVLWIYFTLGLLRMQDYIIDNFLIIFNTEIEAGALKISLANIFAFFFTIQVSIWLSRLVRFILEEEVFSRREQGEKRTSQGAILLILRYSFISFGVLIAFAAAGIDISNIAVVLGALGVGIGFGLQSIFNNLISGIILAVERPMQIGDIVEVHNTMGFVRDIGFRASTIRTYEGAEVIVPNGDFISSKVVNYTLSDKRRRVDIEVNVNYKEDPERVMQILKEVTEELDFLLKTPAPYIRFKAMGDSALEFQVRAWIANFDNGVSLGSQMTLAIFNALKEHDIHIPYPHRNIIITNPKELENDDPIPEPDTKDDK